MLEAIKYMVIIYSFYIDKQTDASSQSFMVLFSSEPEHLKNVIEWNCVHAESVDMILECIQTLGLWWSIFFFVRFF